MGMGYPGGWNPSGYGRRRTKRESTRVDPWSRYLLQRPSRSFESRGSHCRSSYLTDAHTSSYHAIVITIHCASDSAFQDHTNLDATLSILEFAHHGTTRVNSPSRSTVQELSSRHKSNYFALINGLSCYSPSKHTRSQDTARQSSPSIVLHSPSRKRAKRGTLTDLEVWDWDDDRILQESTQKWTSIHYKHFKPSVARITGPNGQRFRDRIYL
ncbi:hypothetical protein HD554DRAFT_1716729 [Boletus coccyginus]|nr:hypothetical protein HD554DRAFT_1716729 [Boletus coccyginus]